MASILAIDDEEGILNIIKSALEKEGHKVVTISNPTSLSKNRYLKFDLILLDVMMPEVDGFSLCTEIRNIVDCPIIFLTAKTLEQDIILFIMQIIVFSKCFSKRLSNEMKILKETTENIQMENLDFDIKYSKILEINEVLSALSKMKTELQQSLNKQWKIEETQKEQMAALAHDIKTPLTIIRGNVELLDELDLDSEQRAFAKNILNESMKMESYIRSLIEIMKSKKEIKIEKKEIDSQVFIQTIEAVAGSITMEKSIKFIMNVKEIPQKFVADEELIQRAIVNVISNEIDYTPINGQILFEVDTNNDYIRFIVEDSGRGFTKEELKYATEQFFQGDKSRNSKLHYGMGLYIVKESLKQLKGNICLENSKETGGAKVSLEIPID